MCTPTCAHLTKKRIMFLNCTLLLISAVFAQKSMCIEILQQNLNNLHQIAVCQHVCDLILDMNNHHKNVSAKPFWELFSLTSCQMFSNPYKWLLKNRNHLDQSGKSLAV